MARPRPKPSRPQQQPATPAQTVGPALQQIADPFQLVSTEIGPHLQALEALRGHPIVTYVLTDLANLADEQMMHLYLHLRELGKQDQLGLFLVSRGGSTEVPWKITSLMREFAKRYSILVPYRAHSAATLTALGADDIVMTEMSELGPVDPSRRHPLLPKDDLPGGDKAPLFISVQDLRHVLEFLKREMGKDLTPDAAAKVYTALFGHVHPLAIGALEQSWALSIQVAERCLCTHMDPENDAKKIGQIVDRLSDHYKSHLYQINRQEAREIGLDVVDATDQEAEAMWGLHQAFAGIQITGDSDLGGQKTKVAGIGYITSSAGITLGIGHAKANKPDEGIFAATWESRVGQAAPQAAAPAPPTPPAGAPPGAP